jgi:hypothetical protein
MSSSHADLDLRRETDRARRHLLIREAIHRSRTRPPVELRAVAIQIEAIRYSARDTSELRMPRHTVLSIVALALAAPAHAQPPDCGWVDGIPSWEASISWSWSNQTSWTTQEGTAFDAQTHDVGSATALLMPAVAGGTPASISASWEVSFSDRLDVAPIGSQPGYELTDLLLSQPMPGGEAVLLFLDEPTCTYRWSFVPWAAGTSVASARGGRGITSWPSKILPGERPIPGAPGPLEFDGRLAATTHAPLDSATPAFLSNAPSAAEVENAMASLPDASVHWSFVPTVSIAPENDGCVNAISLGGTHNLVNATSAPTDPVSACGSGDRSVWFTIMPNSSGMVAISTSRSNFGTVVSAWPLAQTCAALTTEIACGRSGASVPVEQGVPLVVQIVQGSTDGREPSNLVIDVAPEPGAVAASGVACVALAYRARTRRRGHSAVTHRHSASL